MPLDAEYKVVFTDKDGKREAYPTNMKVKDPDFAESGQHSLHVQLPNKRNRESRSKAACHIHGHYEEPCEC